MVNFHGVGFFLYASVRVLLSSCHATFASFSTFFDQILFYSMRRPFCSRASSYSFQFLIHCSSYCPTHLRQGQTFAIPLYPFLLYTNHLIERRPRSPGLETFHLPFHIWNPTYPFVNLRLPRIRPLHSEQPTPYPNRGWTHHRRHLATLLHSNLFEPPLNTHRAPRPKPRHRRHRRNSPLLRRPRLPNPPLLHRPPLTQTALQPVRRLLWNRPRSALPGPALAPADVQNWRLRPHPTALARLPAHPKLDPNQDCRYLADPPQTGSPTLRPGFKISSHHPAPCPK